jgi:acetolactate synthase-1/2/3 large subunit
MDKNATTERLDGGKGLLEAFRRLGVDYIFSSPGSEWAPIWEAVAHQKLHGANGPGFLDCWHETLAVDMAIGYTLSTGRMQAVLIHAGAGLLQGSMGIHGALQCEVPMVVMAGESLAYGEDPDYNPGGQWVRNLSVVGGPHRLVEPLVKFATQVTSTHTLYESVIRAGEMAQRQPQAPVFLNVPLEVMLEEWRAPTAPRQIPDKPMTLTPPEDVTRLAEMLVNAKCPVVTTEGVGRDAAAYASLIELAELLSLPVVEGANLLFSNFPRDNVLHQGFDMKPFWEEMDVTLVIESRVPWYPPSNRPPNSTVVIMDETPHREHMVYQSLQADAYLEGNVARTLADLVAAVKANGVDAAKIEARRAELAERHSALAGKTMAAIEEAKAAPAIETPALCAALTEVMPPETIYLNELTTHVAGVREYLPLNRPNTFYCRQGGLGQGLGLGLGLKLAQPDKPVVILIGDGAFLYNPALQALGASRDFKLPILIVVFDNQKYAAMQGNTKSNYPSGAAVETDTFFGVHIDGPDYAEIAKLFGGHGERVTDPARLAGAIEDAQKAVGGGRTAILNVAMAR